MIKVMRAKFFSKVQLLTLVNCTTLTDIFWEEIFDQNKYKVKLVLDGQKDPKLNTIEWNKNLC